MHLLYSINSLRILSISVLNSASDRLAISSHLVLFLEFCSVLSFGPYFFVSLIWQPLCVCFCVLGKAALTPCLSTPVKLYGAESQVICWGGRPASLLLALCVGRARRGDDATAWILLVPHHFTPFWCVMGALPAGAPVVNPGVDGFVYILRPYGPFNQRKSGSFFQHPNPHWFSQPEGLQSHRGIW